MDILILITKGFIIGLGKILPGVSGAVLAISLGVYEKGIKSITNIFNKKNFIFLLYLGIGMLIAIVTMSNVVLFCIKNYYFWIMLLFCGLIIGGLKELIIIIRDDIDIKNVIYMSISALLIMFLSINTLSFELEYNFITIFILGMIESLTMIIPGVSGTAIHLMLGSYEFVMNMFSKIIIKNFVPFVMGMIFSVLVFIKLISYLLTNYKIKSYFIILGFSISSIIYLISTLPLEVNIYKFIIGIILFIIGIKIGNILSSEK